MFIGQCVVKKMCNLCVSQPCLDAASTTVAVNMCAPTATMAIISAGVAVASFSVKMARPVRVSGQSFHVQLLRLSCHVSKMIVS